MVVCKTGTGSRSNGQDNEVEKGNRPSGENVSSSTVDVISKARRGLKRTEKKGKEGESGWCKRAVLKGANNFPLVD